MTEITKSILTNSMVKKKENLQKEITKTDLLHFEDKAAIQARIDGTVEKVSLFYRADKNSKFVQIEMFDDGGHNDESSNDQLWGATIDWKIGTQYYIMVEGSRSCAFSPSNNLMKPHEIK